MKTRIGDILLYKDGNSFITRSIRKLTNSKYNHVGIYVGNGLVAEALDDGFVLTSHVDVDNYAGIDVYRIKRSPRFNKDILEGIVYQYLGTPYGFFDILKLAIFQLTRYKLFKGRTKALICSEAVAQVYRDYGFNLFKGKNLDYITPEDFAKHKKLVMIRQG